MKPSLRVAVGGVAVLAAAGVVLVVLRPARGPVKEERTAAEGSAPMAGAAAHPRKKPDPARPPIFTSTAPPRFVLSNEPVQAETDPTRAQIVELLERSGLPTPESKRSGEMLREALDRSGVEGVKLGDVKCFQAGCWVDVDYRQRDVFSKFDEEKIQNPRSKFRESPYASGRTSLLVTREKRLFATWYFILVDQ